MSRNLRVLRAVRLGAVVAGSVSLLLAMTVWSETPGPRDLCWAIGVALLVLSLVANRLLRRADRGTSADTEPGENSD